MPSRKIKDGTYKDIAHPIHNEFRGKLEQLILREYENELAKAGPMAAPTQTEGF
jgi:stage V sporulation protein G